MTESTTAKLFDGDSPVPYHSTVIWDSQSLTIQPDGKEHLLISFDDIEEVFQQDKHQAIYIKNPQVGFPQIKIEIEGIPEWFPEFLSQWRMHKKPHIPAFFHLPFSWFIKPQNMIISIVILASALALLYFAVINIYHIVPTHVDTYLGNNFKGKILTPDNTCANPEMERYLNDIMQEMVHDSMWNYQVYIMDIDIENAFALPGGTMLFTSELLKNVESPNEIYGIMAHEITHVQKRHSMQQLITYLGIGFVVTLMTGDGLEGFADPEFIGTAMGGLMALGYSRDFEKEADDGAMNILVPMNITPTGIVSFFERIEEKMPISESVYTKYISTHPMSKDRIEKFESHLNEDMEYRTFPKPLFWKNEGYTLCPQADSSITQRP